MVRFLQLRPRYVGSYAAMAYGLGMAVSGHVRSAATMASVGELLFYGALLYHARKRQRFGMKRIWLAFEVYAGLSIVLMAVNILRVQVWRWHPVAFGLLPLVVIGGYVSALIGKPLLDGKTDSVLTPGLSPRQIPLVIAIAIVWVVLNIYAFPKLHIST
jgi:hypothetical protein